MCPRHGRFSLHLGLQLKWLVGSWGLQQQRQSIEGVAVEEEAIENGGLWGLVYGSNRKRCFRGLKKIKISREQVKKLNKLIINIWRLKLLKFEN